MARRPVPDAKVAALAATCRELKGWLSANTGSSDPEGYSEAFGKVLLGYRALIDAVAMLPKGPACLAAADALPKLRRASPHIGVRLASSYGIDELALLENRVLCPPGRLEDGTEDPSEPGGWVIPVRLVARVDDVKSKLEAAGKPATDKAALEEIMRAAGYQEQRIRRELPKLQMRLSRARKQADST